MDQQEIDEKARTQLVRRRQGLWQDAEQWRATWAQVQRYIVPWMGRSLSGQTDYEWNQGRERPWWIYNECAGDSLEIEAAGLMSGLSSPSRPWKRIQLQGDPKRSNTYNVRLWLDQVNDTMDAIFAGSNVYLALHTIYRELCAFNTGAMAVLADDRTVLHCRPYTCGEYWLATDGRGRVNTFWREFYPTVGEIVNEYGREAVSEATKKLWDEGGLEKRIPVTWVVEANDDRYELKAAKNFPWRSVHYEWNNPQSSDAKSGPHTVLNVSGFKTMPIMAPRWDLTSNDVYGWGPSFTHLSSVRLLQEVEKADLKARQILADPPTKGTIPAEQIDRTPGGHTQVEDTTADVITNLLDVRYDLQATEAKIQRLEQSIRRGFFTDLFMMISNTPVRSEKVTAAEIAAKQQEKMTVLGPMIERVHPELLDKLIRRTYSIMLDQKLVPSPPKEIHGALLEVEYTSILAQAMKMSGLATIERYVGFVGQVAQFKPDALDKVDEDALLDTYLDDIGAPQRINAPPDVVQARRAARAKQAQKEQTTAQAVELSKAAKQLATSPMGTQSVLDGLLNSARGA